MIMFWKGGLVFLGGAILAAASGYWFLSSRNQPLWSWMDAIAVSVPLGQAIGRIGCVMAGCCYGSPCELPWAITFTDPNSLAPVNIPLHPTQLYHCLAGLLTFAILLGAKRFLKTEGMLSGLMLMLYAVFRFSIEFFRGDYRGDFGIISVTQMITLGVFLLGAGMMVYRKKRT
jgi:phosphatidylglycerol:prolipoprotein diacylglycerol transferase